MTFKQFWKKDIAPFALYFAILIVISVLTIGYISYNGVSKAEADLIPGSDAVTYTVGGSIRVTDFTNSNGHHCTAVAPAVPVTQYTGVGVSCY